MASTGNHLPDEKRVYPHTPGPWRVSEGRHKESWAQISAPIWEGFARVVVRMSGDEQDYAVGVANARLIASAPELLQSVREILGWYVEGGHAVPRIFIDRANAAIAKAEGRS